METSDHNCVCCLMQINANARFFFFLCYAFTKYIYRNNLYDKYKTPHAQNSIQTKFIHQILMGIKETFFFSSPFLDYTLPWKLKKTLCVCPQGGKLVVERERENSGLLFRTGLLVLSVGLKCVC